MKTLLKFFTLAALAGTPVLALAEMAGARFPAALSGEALFAVFASASLLSLALHDYARRPRTLPLPVSSAAARVAPLAPAAEAFGHAIAASERYNAGVYRARARTHAPRGSRTPFRPTARR
jgi:hypothetical protein